MERMEAGTVDPRTGIDADQGDGRGDTKNRKSRQALSYRTATGQNRTNHGNAQIGREHAWFDQRPDGDRRMHDDRKHQGAGCIRAWLDIGQRRVAPEFHFGKKGFGHGGFDLRDP